MGFCSVPKKRSNEDKCAWIAYGVLNLFIPGLGMMIAGATVDDGGAISAGVTQLLLFWLFFPLFMALIHGILLMVEGCREHVPEKETPANKMEGQQQPRVVYENYPHQQYAQPPQQQYHAPPPQQQYAQPAPPQQQYAQPAPQQQYYAPPPQQQQYHAPPPQQQYYDPPQQQYIAPPTDRGNLNSNTPRPSYEEDPYAHNNPVNPPFGASNDAPQQYYGADQGQYIDLPDGSSVEGIYSPHSQGQNIPEQVVVVRHEVAPAAEQK